MTNEPPGGAAALPEFDPACMVELDLRDLLRAGGAPKAQILEAVATLPVDGVLHLRTPFLPVPLIQLLQPRGFQYHAASFSDSDWSTWFWRTTPAPRPAAKATGSAIDRSGAEDLRLLPPPEPMLRILERIDREALAFEVLLPFYPEPLIRLLADGQWRLELVEEASDGVRVRLVPGGRNA
ncbi:MAG: DUF2249 domain-containing protein [Gemmatimonadales bacterium]